MIIIKDVCIAIKLQCGGECGFEIHGGLRATVIANLQKKELERLPNNNLRITDQQTC